MIDRHSNQPKRRDQRKALGMAVAYFVLASIWIVLSGDIVDFFAGQDYPPDRIEVYKGLLFVLTTAVALYGVLRTWKPQLPGARPQEPSLPIPLMLLVCVMLLFAGGGYYVFDALKRNEIRKVEQNLATVAQLKSEQILSWLNKQKIDLEVLSKGSMLARMDPVTRHAAISGSETENLMSRMEFVRQRNSYNSITLMDVDGNVRLSTAGSSIGTKANEALLRQALDRRQVVMGDIHWDSSPDGARYLSLSMAAPLIETVEEGGKVTGVMLVEIDLDRYFYPLIQTWPTPSETAETLIFKEDGGDALFLNELRHQKDTALRLRIPADHPTRIAAQAVRGAAGLVSGRDYRDEPVLGYVQKIPDTDWFILAKIDSEEVLLPIRRLALSVTAITLLLLGIGAMTLYFWWRQRTVRFQALQVQSELKQQLLTKQFDYLSKFANDIILLLDDKGNVVQANDRAETAYGYARHELIGKNIRDLRASSDHETMQRQWEAVKENKSLLFEGMHKRKDGSLFPVEVNSRAMESDGHLFIQSIIRDITERKKAEEEFKLAAMVYKGSSEAMLVTDSGNRIIAVNPALEKITGYAAGEVIGKNPNILKSGIQDDAFYQAFWKELNATGRWKGEFWNRKKDGELFVALSSINTIFNPDGSVQRRVALISDVTEKKKSEEMVWQQANFDALTGLPNRRLFQDHLRHEIRKAHRAHQQFALMLLDLDGFKYVNDTLGHAMGDLLLKEAAERLKSCVRESDMVARLGGDEFTVIITELANLRHMGVVAQHILQRLSEPFQLGNEVAHVSASVGITLYPDDAVGLEDLLKNADQAMYAAKQEGRNRYHYFTESMQAAALERMWLVNELRSAVAQRQFTLVYQPIVELSTGCINRAEALLRWNHPVRGMIDPSIFIPLAEETGLIHDIGDWVFFEAASQAAKWRKMHHPDFQISINKSPVQFRAKGNELALWFDYLKMLNLPGQSIAVEITEGLLMDASESVTDQLFAFRDAGIEVSLDDFGTGYSSLSYLKKFDIDRLKIDRVFMRNLTAGSDDLVLCEAIIVMAHKLGIKVIAEGVETNEQRELLHQSGCDFIQGYLISRPLYATELDQLLSSGAAYCPPNHFSD